MSINLQQNDKDLLRRISAGDEQAFALLANRYSDRVYRFIVKIISRTDLAEELVNDIFLRLWLTRENLGDIQNLEVYLFVISRNHAFNAVKKLLREKRKLETWYNNTDAINDNHLTHKVLDLVDEALLHLSEQQRKCWLLSRRMGKSYQEIEQELKISRNTVKTHLRIANASVKQYVLDRISLFVTLLSLAFSKYF